MFRHVLNPAANSLFVQPGNNGDDLVPIAICCSLLDGGLAPSLSPPPPPSLHHCRPSLSAPATLMGSASRGGSTRRAATAVGFINMH